jgi:hypothetical protein
MRGTFVADPMTDATSREGTEPNGVGEPAVPPVRRREARGPRPG